MSELTELNPIESELTEMSDRQSNLPVASWVLVQFFLLVDLPLTRLSSPVPASLGLASLFSLPRSLFFCSFFSWSFSLLATLTSLGHASLAPISLAPPPSVPELLPLPLLLFYFLLLLLIFLLTSICFRKFSCTRKACTNLSCTSSRSNLSSILRSSKFPCFSLVQASPIQAIFVRGSLASFV
jgi:hypothetical protein